MNTCISCQHIGNDMIRCCACDNGPMCMGCMANDIEHGVEDTPICPSCVDTTHWCSDCHMFIAFSSEDPLLLEEGYLCEGCDGVVCGVLLCDWCSYGDYYSIAGEDDEPPEHRQCEKCRLK